MYIYNLILCPHFIIQQSLSELLSTRMKEKPLVENAVLPHTETKKLVHPFIFN